MKTQALVRQPSTLTCGGQPYVLVSPYRLLPSQVGETRSEGPFYDSVPPDPGFVFLPDARFLLGHVPEPMSMYRIQR